VERSLTKIATVSVAAMGDGAYFATDEQVGLLGLESACRQRKGALPPEWSLGTLRTVVETPEFQNISSAKQSKEFAWYVRSRVGQSYKCFALTEDEATHHPAVQPLLLWVSDVSKNHPNEFSSYECTAFTAKYLPTFCEARP
jgi:hypothetical protein